MRVGALGRRSGRARRGGGVEGVGARVAVVQGLAVVGSVGCIFGLPECRALRIFLVEL